MKCRDIVDHSGSGGGTAIAIARDDQRYADITLDNRDHPSDGQDYLLSYRIKATVYARLGSGL